MTRKEQLKKMTLPELELQKQSILNGRVSFEDQVYSAELDDEIRLRKAQERELDKRDEGGQIIEKKPLTMENGAPLSFENLYYRLKSLEEKHNAMYVSHTQNLESLNTHVREFKVVIDQARKFNSNVNSLNGRIDVISETHNDRFSFLNYEAKTTSERLEQQSKTLGVIFENYNSQNEEILKLNAAIKELKQENGESSVKERAMRRVQIKQEVRKERKEARTLFDIYMTVEAIESEIHSLKSKLKQAESNMFLVNAVSWALLMCIAAKLL